MMTTKAEAAAMKVMKEIRAQAAKAADDTPAIICYEGHEGQGGCHEGSESDEAKSAKADVVAPANEGNEGLQSPRKRKLPTMLRP